MNVNSPSLDVGTSSIADTTINIESSSSGDPKLNFKSTTDRSANIDFTEGGTLQGSIFYKHNGDTLGISTGSTNRTARLSINETTSTFTSNVEILKGSPLIRVKDSSNDVRGFLTVSSGVVKMGGSDNNNVEIQSNGTTRITIKSAGDVSFTGWIEGNGENALYSNTSTGLLIQAPNTTEEIHFRDKNGSVGMLYNAGTKKLGIGDTSPTELLEIASDSDPTIIIRTDTADQANSGKISFRESAGGTTGADLRYDGSANNFIIDTTEVSNALVIARTTGQATFAGNLVINGSQFDYFRAVNSGNPEFHMGSSDTNKLHIQTVYTSSAQTLSYVTFTTKSSLTSADAGKMEFYVDESKKLSIDDGGIELW